MENEGKKIKQSDITKGQIAIAENAIEICNKQIFELEESRRMYRRTVRSLKEKLRGEIAHERVFDTPEKTPIVITDKKVEELKKKLFS